jgi:hypothetical protein
MGNRMMLVREHKWFLTTMGKKQQSQTFIGHDQPFFGF